jgi:hypothetical protein
MDRATDYDSTAVPIVLNYIVALALAVAGSFIIAVIV